MGLRCLSVSQTNREMKLTAVPSDALLPETSGVYDEIGAQRFATTYIRG
jgi:hypothetical protein